MNKDFRSTWKQYDAGMEYKNRIGLYETVRRNERFYQGDQWSDATGDLSHPVFNLVRRITDYLVASVSPHNVSISYSDERLPFIDHTPTRSAVIDGMDVLNKNAAYRWKSGNMRALSHRALLDAALTGDGIFYCWWDMEKQDGQPFAGDIHTTVIDNTNLFVADVTLPDIQSQEYLILSGSATVESLRSEAQMRGVAPKEIAKIVPDGIRTDFISIGTPIEPDAEQKATYLIRFYREDGKVMMEKSVRDCLICRICTGLSHYPVAAFNWCRARNRFHGHAPVSDMIANQKYINTAYAMAMKHMSNTAFSKVVYDKSRIPEWTNEVGEAIAAMGGGNVADAVSVIGTGKMQDGYLQLIDSVIENTKSMMGATEAALGDAEANNTSAILALQTASRLALSQVRAQFAQCVGELASIWADMLCTYCHPDRKLIVIDGKSRTAKKPDYKLLREELLRATAQVEEGDAFSPSATAVLLNRLLELGAIDQYQYVELLPDGTVSNKEPILEKIKEKER